MFIIFLIFIIIIFAPILQLLPLHPLNIASSSPLHCNTIIGSLVGAYFIGRQLPYFGPEVYYDVLTSAGTYVTV